MAKINPIDIACDQFTLLKEKLQATCDLQERKILFKRLANLLAVMEFLISINKTH